MVLLNLFGRVTSVYIVFRYRIGSYFSFVGLCAVLISAAIHKVEDPARRRIRRILARKDFYTSSKNMYKLLVISTSTHTYGNASDDKKLIAMAVINSIE